MNQILKAFKEAWNSNISMRCLGSSPCFSLRHHAITRGFARFKVCKNQKKHSGARPTLKTFVSTKFSKLFALSVIFNFEHIHPSVNFKGKHPFKPLCWNIYKNCDVDVAIDHAGYQSRKQQEKNYPSGFLRSFYLAGLTSGYSWYSSFTAYTPNDNSEKENTICGLFAFIWVELRALLISRPPSCVRMGRSCKVEVLICV